MTLRWTRSTQTWAWPSACRRAGPLARMADADFKAGREGCGFARATTWPACWSPTSRLSAFVVVHRHDLDIIIHPKPLFQINLGPSHQPCRQTPSTTFTHKNHGVFPVHYTLLRPLSDSVQLLLQARERYLFVSLSLLLFSSDPRSLLDVDTVVCFTSVALFQRSIIIVERASVLTDILV